MSKRPLIATLAGAILVLVAACDSGGPACISPVPTPNACPTDKNTNGAGGYDGDFGGGGEGGGGGQEPVGAADAGSLGDIFGGGAPDPNTDRESTKDATAGAADDGNGGVGMSDAAPADDAAIDDAAPGDAPCDPGTWLDVWPGDGSIGILCEPDAIDTATEEDAP
jgi:hypothetical protein